MFLSIQDNMRWCRNWSKNVFFWQFTWQDLLLIGSRCFCVERVGPRRKDQETLPIARDIVFLLPHSPKSQGSVSTSEDLTERSSVEWWDLVGLMGKPLQLVQVFSCHSLESVFHCDNSFYISKEQIIQLLWTNLCLCWLYQATLQ